MSRTVLLLAGAFFGIGLFGCRGSTDDVDAAGHPTHKLTFTEDLTIGRVESDDIFFGYVHEVRTDADGNIYVSDSREANVSAFDADGQFRFSVAGLGEAPDQIQVLQTFHVAGDSIMVFDHRWPSRPRCAIPITISSTP